MPLYKILLKLIQEPIVDDIQTYHVKGSIGWIEVDDFPGNELNEIINLADYAMLEAKAKGKNQILQVQPKLLERYKYFLNKKL